MTKIIMILLILCLAPAAQSDEELVELNCQNVVTLSEVAERRQSQLLQMYNSPKADEYWRAVLVIEHQALKTLQAGLGLWYEENCAEG